MDEYGTADDPTVCQPKDLGKTFRLFATLIFFSSGFVTNLHDMSSGVPRHGGLDTPSPSAKRALTPVHAGSQQRFIARRKDYISPAPGTLVDRADSGTIEHVSACRIKHGGPLQVVEGIIKPAGVARARKRVTMCEKSEFPGSGVHRIGTNFPWES